MSEREHRCKLCRWWSAPGDRGNYRYGHFECRRHAPVVNESRNGNWIIAQKWPQTGGDDWCGEFQPLAATKEAPP